ncbi:YggS family pyridoxal phosphate-dependent enzyme [Clostridia bacterium OttesenSCG-928-O13]|nr:YggS family pyridoxal phosphate-dependent enzyme [Clostridia bacterium OttesenSCG-928-O13]
MTEKSYSIAQRVEQVRERMENAAIAAGRNPEEITLVGVTKTQPAAAVRELIQAGVDVIGENRVQELLEKEPALAGLPHKTHLIGHLQRNKAKFLPGHIDMLQSLSSVQTIEALEKAYADHSGALDVLIEVNIGEETSKTGIDKSAVMELAARVYASEKLRLRGLMAIPPFVEGEAVRTYFAQMRQLFIDIKAKKMDNDTVNVLSMGMSSDFEYAIAEGATMIRVGTQLFGPRQYT